MYLTVHEVTSEVIDKRGVTVKKLGGEFVEDGHRVISAKLIKKSKVDLDAGEKRFVNHEIYKKWMSSKLLEGDVILTSEAPLGEVAYIQENLDWCLGQRLFCLRPNREIIDGRYLYYALKTKQVQADLESRGTGTTVIGIRQSELLNVQIPIQDLETQKRISNLLGGLDDKIELNQQMNETFEEIAKTLFKSWFIDFDPVRAKAEGRSTKLSKEISDLFPDSFEDSELGQIPEGFKVDSVDNQYDISIGKTPPRKEPQWFSENPQDIPWASIKDMGDADVYINKTSEFLTNEAIEKFNIRVIPKNNVILSFKMTVGRVAILQKDMCTNEAIAHFVPKDNDLSKAFTYCLLKSIRYESLSSTSSIATAVNSKIIKAMKCIFPSKALLIAFNEFCHPIYKKIETNTNEIETLISLRDALLPKLISGELKISDAENLVKEAGT
jgi:type I restriction enzyme S subunit